ncbi:MAG: hypothetical protein OHK0056_02340 [Bacteriovoracaceae bacterium]
MSIGQGLVETKQIISDLNSPYWYIRAKAVNTIEELTNPKALREIYLRIEALHDDAMRVVLIDALDTILRSHSIEMIGESLLILILESEQKSVKIKAMANQNLRKFLENEEIARYLKILGLRYCVQHLPLNKRMLVTHLVGEFKISELIPLVLENFKSTERSIIKVTIEVLIKLEDSRGNRFIKNYLNNKNEHDNEFLDLSIRAIGRLGTFFDFFQINKFLKSHNPKIRASAVIAICKILDFYSLFGLFRHFKKEDSSFVKAEIIRQFGRLPYRLSAKILLTIFEFEKNVDLLQNCEWALHQLPKKYLIPELMKRFFKTSDITQFRLIKILGEINDVRCIDLILRILTEIKNEFILIESFDVAVSYDRPELLFEIKKFLYSDSKNLQYYALLSALKHNCHDVWSLFEEMIERENLTYGQRDILLKFASEKFDSLPESVALLQKIRRFIVESIKTGKMEAKVFAIEIMWKYAGESEYQFIYHNFLVERNRLVLKSFAHNITRTVVSNPQLLALHPEVLNHKEIYLKFRPSKAPIIFWSSYLDCLKQYGLEVFNQFQSYHSIEIAHSLMSWMKNPSENNISHFCLALDLIRKSKVQISDDFLDFLISQVYVWADEVGKFDILLFVTDHGRPSDFDFIWQETFNKESFKQQHLRLINKYYGAIE